MLNRAYAMLEVRAVQEDNGADERVFEGWATTPHADRMGDVIDPMGAKFHNPLVLLHQHDSDRPIGTVRFEKATKDGIAFKATIPKIAEPGPLKDRVDTAWGEIKAGLVRAVSIGFRILKDGVEVMGDGLKFTAIEIVELSAVSVPANANATITNIRSFDLGARAASGQIPVVKAMSTPASRDTPATPERKGAAMPRTISEQIEDFTKTIAAKEVRRNAIAAGAGERGETFDASETEEFDTLTAEIDAAKAHLTRLKSLEVEQAQTATPVIRQVPTGGSAGERANPTMGRVEPVVRAAERCAPGIRMARVAKTLILSKLSGVPAVELAAERYGQDPAVVEVVRAAIGAGTTLNPAWAGALVGEAGTIVADFVAFLRPQTILGRFGTGGIPDLRNVPFRTALVGQTSGGKGYWVGEGKAKPLTKFDFERKSLEPLKVAAIAVLTDEVIKSSSPSADAIVRDALVDALRERLDLDFIDPAKAAVVNISPASITNGVPPIPSSGTDAEAVRADVKAAFAAYTANNNSLAGGVWIAPSNLAASLGMMTNLLGQPEFNGVDRNGGSLGGFPIISSDYVPDDTVVLANAREIYLGDEGGFEVDMSREASLEMSDAPTMESGIPQAATAPIVSLWQTNSVGIRAERTINWMKRRADAVVVLSGVAWGEAGSATLGAGRGNDRVSGRAA
jgi:HK97 family phage prohead protease